MTEKEIRYHNLYMDVASRVALMSHAVRSKVGAILVKDGNIVGHGWNGQPKGADNCCEKTVELEDGTTVLETLPTVQHAEENLLLKMLQAGNSAKDGTLYVTLLPCIHCAKMVYGAGIKNVYYRHSYRDESGVEFLSNFGVAVSKL
jgi:dCMP deaminase